MTPPELLLKQTTPPPCLKRSSSPPKTAARRVSFDLARNQVLKLPSMTSLKNQLRALEERGRGRIPHDHPNDDNNNNNNGNDLEEPCLEQVEGALLGRPLEEEVAVSKRLSLVEPVLLSEAAMSAVSVDDESLSITLEEKTLPNHKDEQQQAREGGPKKRHSKRGKHKRRNSSTTDQPAATAAVAAAEVGGACATNTRSADMQQPFGSWHVVAMVSAGGGLEH